MKKAIFCIAAIMMASMFFAACDYVPVGEKTDESKTQLYVSNYNGGYGEAWLNSVKEGFEREYADYELNGKKGVQILIDNAKVLGAATVDTAKASKNEIFFNEEVYYESLIQNNVALDISDIVTGEGKDGKTILSKFYPEQQEYYNRDGKYYAIPHYAGYGGIIYNKKLWNDKNLYIQGDNDGNPVRDGNGYMLTNFAGNRSKGPNGVKGDYDDGLPATYEEFFWLCGEMSSGKSVTPFTWPGQTYSNPYTSLLVQALAADYEGKADTMVKYTFDGTANYLVDDIDGGGLFLLNLPKP